MNKNHFSKTMSSKTEAELKALIANNKTYIEDARLAAIWELEERNLKSDEIVEAEKVLIQEKAIKLEEQKKLVLNKENKYFTDDPNAPELYTKTAITMFSTVFSTIFGAVLLMSNLKAVNNKQARFWVLIFGIGYTAVIITVVNQFRTNTNLALLFNFGGALILTEFFWNKHIGKEQKHRKKKIWKPLIISIIITIPFILAIVYGK